jgi:spore maturation protein CgeB
MGGGRQNGLVEEIQRTLGDSFNNERYFYGEDHAKRLNMGHIVFQCSQFKEVTRRIFEGMACGKMVLTDRLPEDTRLHEMFKDGEDIVYYNDAKDAIEKIRYYTNNPLERDAIANNGKNKILSTHTVAHRVDQFEDIVTELS